MRKTFVAAVIGIASSTPLAAFAQAKPEPEFTFTGNAGLFSDYRFRGFTQTDYKPAFQGGFDFSHKSGFYLGNWNSNVEQSLFNGASLEMDFYGGYKTTFGEFGIDVGVIYYYYPGTGKVSPGVDAENFEAYIGGSWGPASLKYFYSFTDFFGLNSADLGLPGNIDTKGSQYLDLTVNWPLDGGWTIVAHAGWQKIADLKKFGPNVFGVEEDSYYDYKLGVTYDIGGSGWIVGAAVVGTSEKNLFTVGDVSEGGGKTRGVFSISKTF